MEVERPVVERVLKAVNFQDPDRVPVWEALEHQGLYERFAPGVPFPECAAIACERLGIDATYGCMPQVSEERAEGGHVHAAQTVWSTEPTFRTPADLRAYDPGRPDERRIEEQVLAGHAAEQEVYAPHTLYLPQNGGWGFIPGYDAQTFTVLAVAIAEDLPAVERFWDINMEHAIARNSVTARHRLAPVVQCCEDVAYKTGLMVSPELLRRHFFPRFKQVIAPLKEAGIKVIWHSDGNIMSMVEDAVECGFDGVNPLDPSAGMDMGEVRRKHPGLILVGNVGAEHCLRFGTPDDVRADVRRCIRQGGVGGGLLVQSGDGELMPDVPLENALAYFDEVHRFGRYPIAAKPA